MNRATRYLLQVARIATAFLAVFWAISLLQVVQAFASGQTALWRLLLAVIVASVPALLYLWLTRRIARGTRQRALPDGDSARDH